MLELPEAKTMVAEILQANPGAKFINVTDCVYFNDDGSPCCVVGHVFSRMGILPDNLIPNYPWQTPNSANLLALYPTWRGKISHDASEFLAEVQVLQDDKKVTWGVIFSYLYGEANGED